MVQAAKSFVTVSIVANVISPTTQRSAMVLERSGGFFVRLIDERGHAAAGRDVAAQTLDEALAQARSWAPGGVDLIALRQSGSCEQPIVCLLTDHTQPARLARIVLERQGTYGCYVEERGRCIESRTALGSMALAKEHALEGLRRPARTRSKAACKAAQDHAGESRAKGADDRR